MLSCSNLLILYPFVSSTDTGIDTSVKQNILKRRYFILVSSCRSSFSFPSIFLNHLFSPSLFFFFFYPLNSWPFLQDFSSCIYRICYFVYIINILKELFRYFGCIFNVLFLILLFTLMRRFLASTFSCIVNVRLYKLLNLAALSFSFMLSSAYQGIPSLTLLHFIYFILFFMNPLSLLFSVFLICGKLIFIPDYLDKMDKITQIWTQADLHLSIYLFLRKITFIVINCLKKPIPK